MQIEVQQTVKVRHLNCFEDSTHGKKILLCSCKVQSKLMDGGLRLLQRFSMFMFCLESRSAG